MNKHLKLYTNALENDIYTYNCDKSIYGIEDRFLFKESKIPFKLNKFLKNCIIAVFPVLYFFNLLRLIVLIFANYKFYQKHVLFNKEYFLAVSDFPLCLQQKVLNYSKNAIWLTNIGLSKEKFTAGGQKYQPIEQLITVKDIFESFVNSLYAPIIVAKFYGTFYILYTLNSFDWFVYKKALDRIPNFSTIVFFNQKDRWLPLIDSVITEKKVLIQHGTEIVKKKSNLLLEYKDGLYCYDMPYKYETVTELYAFSDEDYNALLHSSISNSPKKHVVGFGFKVDSIDKDRFSILIVGVGSVSPNNNIEETIIKLLSQLDVDIFLKKHPTINSDIYNDLRSAFDFHFIDYAFFPNVDVVISYESTLALEYESIGTTVLYYTEHDVEFILNYIKRQLLHDPQRNHPRSR